MAVYHRPATNRHPALPSGTSCFRSPCWAVASLTHPHVSFPPNEGGFVCRFGQYYSKVVTKVDLSNCAFEDLSLLSSMNRLDSLIADSNNITCATLYGSFDIILESSQRSSSAMTGPYAPWDVLCISAHACCMLIDASIHVFRPLLPAIATLKTLSLNRNKIDSLLAFIGSVLGRDLDCHPHCLVSHCPTHAHSHVAC